MANTVTAKDYLTNDLHDFYIYIHIHDYRFKKLTEDEQKHILDSLEDIEKALCEKYGKHASFEIYFDSEHKAEYEDGIKI